MDGGFIKINLSPSSCSPFLGSSFSFTGSPLRSRLLGNSSLRSFSLLRGCLFCSSPPSGSPSFWSRFLSSLSPHHSSSSCLLGGGFLSSNFSPSCFSPLGCRFRGGYFSFSFCGHE